MLRSNNIGTVGHTAHTEAKESSHHQIYKHAAFTYQQPRSSLKENAIQSNQQYKRTVHHTEGNQAETTAVSSRLLSIRNKYQRADVCTHREPYLEGIALKDDKLLNRYNNPELKRSTEEVKTGALQRSFSFVNREVEDPKIRNQMHKPLDLKCSERAYSEIKAQLRKTSSFGLIDDTNKYKFNSTQKYTNPNSKCLDDSKYPKYNTNEQETKNRAVSEYQHFNRTTLTPKALAFQYNSKTHENIPCINPDDQRIDSIDKINIKIKEILKYLNENEGKTEVQNDKQSGEVVHKNYTAQQRLHTINTHIESDTRSSEVFRNDGEKRSLIHEYGRKKDQYRRIFTQTDEIENKYTYQLQKDDNSKSSGIDKCQDLRTTMTRNKDDKDNTRQTNPRDIDFEIKKIEDKIKRSEEEKRKLNIRFEDISAKSDSQSTQFRAENKALITKNTLYRHSTKYQKDSLQPQRSTISQKIAVVKSQMSKSPDNYRSCVAKESQFGVIRSADRKSWQCEQIPRAQPLSLKLIPVQCEIEEEQEPVTARESQRFIDVLRQQVRLDEELRNAKVWFESKSEIQDKWNQIQSLLSKNGMQLELEKIKIQFQSTLDQHNPFYITQEGTVDSIGTLVDKYLSTKQHWQKSILKCFDGRQLKEQNFTKERLDLERKGYLTVEDFVRFLNIETGTFFRNRDLILIFRRLTKTESVTFDEMIRAVVKS